MEQNGGIHNTPVVRSKNARGSPDQDNNKSARVYAARVYMQPALPAGIWERERAHADRFDAFSISEVSALHVLKF